MSESQQIKDLTIELEAAMQDGIKECATFDYHPIIYIEMIKNRGGVATMHALIDKQVPTEGYNRLYKERRLDLTCEALLLENPRFHDISLFPDIEKLLRISHHRLKNSGYISKVN